MTTHNPGVSRRSFLKGAGLASAAALAGGVLAGCAPAQPQAAGSAPSLSSTGAGDAFEGPAFLRKPEPIAEFAETHDYDVVVVGAGNSGVVAALKAREEGAKVALLQNLPEASAFGFAACGIDLDKTDPAAQEAMISLMTKNNAYRSDRRLLRAWADNSGEAILWLRDRQEKAGISQRAESKPEVEISYNGYTATFVKANPDPTYMQATPAVCEYAISQGVDFFGSTPAVQLVAGDAGVTGVVAGEEGAYQLFNAAKGVILSTGDFCCNPEMIDFYCPDVNGFPPLTEGRDGDGHCMGVWAGGRIEPIGHTKMIHDFWMNSAPFLLVSDEGERMADEHMPWWEMNTLMRSIMQKNADTPDAATIFSIMDADWATQADGWAQIDPAIEIHSNEAPESVTFTAQSIEELAGLINVDAARLKATVDRYNEMVVAGRDDDFGKDARFLAPIQNPPFRAVQRDFNWGLSAILGGLVVNEENRVVDESDEPIPGLFATGNASGPFFGGVDYPMEIAGLSIGRAITTGYIAGRAAARS